MGVRRVGCRAANSVLTTSNTREGLFYQLCEGTTLDNMVNGDSKVGDCKPWSPKVTVKGGTSGFYSIKVGKGEQSWHRRAKRIDGSSQILAIVARFLRLCIFHLAREELVTGFGFGFR